MKGSNKIIPFAGVRQVVNNARSANQTTVLVGGVFDILHFGHIRFLEEAKKQGDLLFVALEPDAKVKITKGAGRPIHDQGTRANMLAALVPIDYVFVLPHLTTNKEYEDMVQTIHPDVIGVTENDPFQEEKRRQIEAIGGKLVVVTPKIPTPSTTQLVKLLALE